MSADPARLPAPEPTPSSPRTAGHNVSAVVSQSRSARSAVTALAGIATIILSFALKSKRQWASHAVFNILFLLVNAKKIHGATDASCHALLAAVWSVWGGLMLVPVGHALRRPRLAFRVGAVAPVAAILSVLLRRDIGHPGAAGAAMIKLFWDPPLLAAGYIVDKCGGRMWHDGTRDKRLVSVLSADCAMGSRPLARDVAELQRHNVRCVVNMCAEYAGPQAAYDAAGIGHLRLPTIDTGSPSLQDLEDGVAWVKEQLQGGDGRVYVHCKGGRGRAACFALCWQVERGAPWRAALDEMRRRRPVAEPVIATYPAVRDFIARRGQRI